MICWVSFAIPVFSIFSWCVSSSVFLWLVYWCAIISLVVSRMLVCIAFSVRVMDLMVCVCGPTISFMAVTVCCYAVVFSRRYKVCSIMFSVRAVICCPKVSSASGMGRAVWM